MIMSGADDDDDDDDDDDAIDVRQLRMVDCESREVAGLAGTKVWGVACLDARRDTFQHGKRLTIDTR